MSECDLLMPDPFSHHKPVITCVRCFHRPFEFGCRLENRYDVITVLLVAQFQWNLAG